MFEEGSIFNQLLVERLNYFIYVVLLLIGLWAMIAKNNLIKKLIGMSVFQTAIILFYVSIGVKDGATIPIYLPEHDPHASHLALESNASEVGAHGPQVLEASLVSSYTNPLPHVLMLTAIVVGVATLGLALSVCLRIYRGYGTVEEDELLEKLEQMDGQTGGGRGRRRPRRRSPRRNTLESNQSRKVTSAEKSGSQKPNSSRRPNPKNAKPKPSGESLNKSETKDENRPKPVRKRRKSPPRKPREDSSQ